MQMRLCVMVLLCSLAVGLAAPLEQAAKFPGCRQRIVRKEWYYLPRKINNNH
jgi:hypothetical protein